VPCILGIDTSCDDTGVGLVRDGEIIANVIASQATIHDRFGGVVPEQASREHVSILDSVVREAISQAGTSLDSIDVVAATYGPGLMGSLLVGLSYGRALAWSRGLQFLRIHHLEGHIASTFATGTVETPFLCLIVSGGHTSLFEVRAWGSYIELGATRDDAAGEAFDKVARLLGLPYPGGPPLSRLALSGNPDMYKLPRPLMVQDGFDFSFSGLKTAVATLLEKVPNARQADVAASFQEAVTDTLIRTTLRAAKRTHLRRLVVAGGVAANRRLRKRLQDVDLEIHVPPPDLTTDNGAMIALAASKHLGRSPDRDWTTDAQPYLPLAN
jgi:N6-L-threonylcarbamoyladenine synthase